MAQLFANPEKISWQSLHRATSALAEVAEEELEIIPSQNAFTQFKKDVRQMASDTDRLMAKASQLSKQVNPNARWETLNHEPVATSS